MPSRASSHALGRCFGGRACQKQRWRWRDPRSSSNSASARRAAWPRAQRARGLCVVPFPPHAGHRLRARRARSRPLPGSTCLGLVAAYPERGSRCRARGWHGAGDARPRPPLEVGKAPPFGPPPRHQDAGDGTILVLGLASGVTEELFFRGLLTPCSASSSSLARVRCASSAPRRAGLVWTPGDDRGLPLPAASSSSRRPSSVPSPRARGDQRVQPPLPPRYRRRSRALRLLGGLLGRA